MHGPIHIGFNNYYSLNQGMHTILLQLQYTTRQLLRVSALTGGRSSKSTQLYKTAAQCFLHAVAENPHYIIFMHNIKSTWEHNKNKPRRQAVANFRLNTGHDCLAPHLYRIKISSHNYCTICKQKNTIMDKEHLLKCPKLDNTARDLPKLYWDARRLMD